MIIYCDLQRNDFQKMQTGLTKKSIGKLKWNSKNCSNNTKEGQGHEKQEIKTERTNRKQITVDLSPINIILKVIKLNAQIKRQRMSMCYLQQTHFRFKNTNRLEGKEWEKLIMQTTSTRKLERLHYYQTK